MCQRPEKRPPHLTATQLRPLGEAVIGHIGQIASRMTGTDDVRAARQDLSLLTAYVELATLIIGTDGLPSETVSQAIWAEFKRVSDGLRERLLYASLCTWRRPAKKAVGLKLR